MRRSTFSFRAGSLTLLAALALGTLVAPVATAGPDKPAPSPSRSATGQVTLKMRPKDGASTQSTQQEFTCWPFAYWGTTGVGLDDYLEETVGLYYSGGVDCDTSITTSGEVGLVDGSPDFNGQAFVGNVLGSSGIYGYGYGASASETFQRSARTYNGARRAGPFLDLYLGGPAGSIWEGCYWIPGAWVSYTCEGIGTSSLHLGLVGVTEATGMTQACRVQSNALLTVEEQRLSVLKPGSSVPASTDLLRKKAGIQKKVVDFKQQLCAIRSTSEAASFADSKGLDLWTEAVKEAKAAGTALDDRQLYWARLSMTAALAQWTPAFPVFNRISLIRSLDRASRGMTSHDFPADGTRRAFVSGFDPFGLNGDINAGNPSGAAVLKLDGAKVGGAIVQAVIFPVRYEDFDAGLVENVFGPHLAGAQRADLVTTVSRGGGGSFDLEFYNGQKRWTDIAFPDNLNVYGAGAGNTPLQPLGLAPGPEFVQTTLPVDAMAAVSNSATGPVVRVNTFVREQFAPGGQPVPQSFGPTVPTSLAVEGSGGGFLSNEIAYRVTRLRDELGSAVPAGHVHTPLSGAANILAGHYETILAAGVTAQPRPPIKLTANAGAFLTGMVPVYTVTGPPNAQIIWYATHNGALVEANMPLGTTDASGNWTGAYHVWLPGQAGHWVKYVRVNGRLAQVDMQVF